MFNCRSTEIAIEQFYYLYKFHGDETCSIEACPSCDRFSFAVNALLQTPLDKINEPANVGLALEELKSLAQHFTEQDCGDCGMCLKMKSVIDILLRPFSASSSSSS